MTQVNANEARVIQQLLEIAKVASCLLVDEAQEEVVFQDLMELQRLIDGLGEFTMSPELLDPIELAELALARLIKE